MTKRKTELGPGPDRKGKKKWNEKRQVKEKEMGYQESGRGTLPVHEAVKGKEQSKAEVQRESKKEIYRLERKTEQVAETDKSKTTEQQRKEKKRSESECRVPSFAGP